MSIRFPFLPYSMKMDNTQKDFLPLNQISLCDKMYGLEMDDQGAHGDVKISYAQGFKHVIKSINDQVAIEKDQHGFIRKNFVCQLEPDQSPIVKALANIKHKKEKEVENLPHSGNDDSWYSGKGSFVSWLTVICQALKDANCIDDWDRTAAGYRIYPFSF